MQKKLIFTLMTSAQLGVRDVWLYFGYLCSRDKKFYFLSFPNTTAPRWFLQEHRIRVLSDA